MRVVRDDRRRESSRFRTTTHDRSPEYIGVTWRRDACKKGDTKYRRARFVRLATPPRHTLAYFSDREERVCRERVRGTEKRACARVCTYLRRCLVTVFKDVSLDLLRLGDWFSLHFFRRRYWNDWMWDETFFFLAKKQQKFLFRLFTIAWKVPLSKLIILINYLILMN